MIKRHSVLLAFAVFAGAAFAQGLPTHYPESFQRTGIIDDVQRETLIVNDVPYSFSDEVVVHSYLSEAMATVNRLRLGMKIGYRVGQNRQVSEIWILPDYYDLSTHRR